MDDFSKSILQHAYLMGYEMVTPEDDHALILKKQGFITFPDKSGRFGFVRATLTEKGKEFYEQNYNTGVTK